MIGVGGGSAIDTAKAVVENSGALPLVIVPTVASNDALCRGIAVICNEESRVVKALATRRNSDIVLVDTGIIASAPVRMFAAGLGDALAIWFEARACHRTRAKNLALGHATNTAVMMSKLCCDILMEGGTL